MSNEILNDSPDETVPPAKGHSSAKSRRGDGDLSELIQQAVEREPLDQVRCVRVFGNYYRCNWWTRLGGSRKGLDYDWAGLITDHIRKSRFLTATMESGKLVMQEVVVLPVERP